MKSLEEALNEDGYLIVASTKPHEVGHILNNIFSDDGVHTHPFMITEIVSVEESIEYSKRHGYPEVPIPGRYYYKVVTD